VRHYGRTVGRRIGAILGFFLSAACIGIGAKAEHPYLVVLFLSLGDGFLYVAGASSVAAVIDIAGPFIWITRNVALAGKILGGLRFERGELLPEKHLVSPRFA